MANKSMKSVGKPPVGDLDEARAVQKLALEDLEESAHEDRPKYYDAWSRISNVVRQLEKDRKKSIAEFTDDEIAEYVRSLPERRRDGILVAIQATSLAGKPLF